MLQNILRIGANNEVTTGIGLDFLRYVTLM